MSEGNSISIKYLVDEMESMQDEKDDVSARMKELMAAAKANGFDVKAVREVLRRRKMNRDARIELDDLVSAYEDEIYPH